ncbi:MAG: diguanylate cyclase [Methyloprofundus sp.]|nr:MAG: diguanylate cyclase [Methyloprofundus sp.]
MPSKHLHHKLVIYILCSALFIAGIAISFAFISEFSRSQEHTEVMLNQLMDTVEKTAAIAAYSRDKVIAKDVIDGLLRNDSVFSASISSDNIILAEKSKTALTKDTSQLARSLHSPFAKQQLIGQLIISPNIQFNLMEAKHAAYASAINSLLLITVTTVILLVLVRSNISHPLLTVSNTVHAIKAGKQNRIPLLESHKHNELGRLIDDINDLLINQEIKFKQEEILRKSMQHMEQQLRHIFDSSSAGLFLLDNFGHLINYNSTLLTVLHCETKPSLTFTNKDFATLFIKEKREFQLMLSNALQSAELQSQDFSLQQHQTPAIWIHCLLSKVIDASGKERIEGVVFDVTKRVLSEQATQHKADHDSLTGLLLRQATRERFNHHTTGNDFPKVSVFLLDLDGFKQANDTHGHDVGDIVLRRTAQRLSACVRVGDLVCRLGGDEFLIIVLDNNTYDGALDIAEKMITNIQSPISINNNLSVQVGASIGIAITPQHGLNFDNLVKSADESMYEVKRQGKNGLGIMLANQIQVKLFRPHS